MPQLFAKYMHARLNSSQICTSTLSLIGSFWLSQGVYPGYTFGYPPKSGGNGYVYEIIFSLGLPEVAAM